MILLCFLVSFLLTKTWGAQLFDPSAEMCCLGKIHELNGSTRSNFYCCGDEAYDSVLNICCQGLVLPRLPESTVSCCGQSLYDFKSAICCQETIVELPVATGNLSSLDSSENVTAPGGEEELVSNANREVYLPLDCCGQEGYNWHMDMCCQNGVRPRPFQEAECCGLESVYDVRKGVCCKDKVANTESALYATNCCGNEAYNSYSSMCCKGKVKEKKDPQRNYSCCSGEIYDLDTDLCCRDEVIIQKPQNENQNSSVECCGSATFFPESEMCCNGIVHKRKYNDANSSLEVAQSCCGDKVYSTGKEACCNDNVHQLQSNGINSIPICCGNDLLVNPNWEMCCAGKIVARRSTFTQCCGLLTFESNRDICCGSKVFTRGSAREHCCGDEIYNYDSQVCCYERNSYTILNKDGAKIACCLQ